MSRDITEKLIEPLQKYLKQKDIVTLHLSAPCKVHLKRDGVVWQDIYDEQLNMGYWQDLLYGLAEINQILIDDLKFGDGRMGISAILDDAHSIEILMGNQVSNSLAVAIKLRFGRFEHENKHVCNPKIAENIMRGFWL